MIRLALLLLALACGAPRAEDDGQAKTRRDAGAKVDPVYGELAKQTGGRVYDMRKPEDQRAFQRDVIEGPKREARRAFWREFFAHPEKVGEKLPVSDATKAWAYALLKWLAYSAWCWVGLGMAGGRRWLAPAWGLFRAGMGLAFGMTVFVLLVAVFGALRWTPPDQGAWYALLYLGIYIPVRWIEWSLMALALGVGPKKWRAGGIAVSCGADLVQILLFGSLIPVGRFMC